MFFLPVLIFLILDKRKKFLYLKKDVNKAIEHYMILQIVINLLNIYSIIKKGSFDLGSGDIIAGTFRFPMTVKADSNNMLFSLSMILLLFVYLNFCQNLKKAIILPLILIIFLASVNHLIVIALVSLILSYFSIISFFTWCRIFIFSGIFIFLCKLLQPANFYNIVNKIYTIILVFIVNFKYLKDLSLKFQYIENLFSDFLKYPYMFFLGSGLGTYSSRAALYLTGDYVNLPISNISKFMLGNTYPLFLSLKKFSLGSFNYPWGSFFSLLAETGIIFSVILMILFAKELKKVINQKRRFVFILIFFILIGFMENYYEYFQATFIFFFTLICYHNSGSYFMFKKKANEDL